MKELIAPKLLHLNFRISASSAGTALGEHRIQHLLVVFEVLGRQLLLELTQSACQLRLAILITILYQKSQEPAFVRQIEVVL